MILLEPAMKSVTRLLLLISMLACCLVAWGMPFPNEDLFLGFCAGRDIVDGHLAGPDRWSFTLPASVWVDQSWLSHLIYYLSFLQFSYLGPVVIKGLLLMACAGLLYGRCRNVGATVDLSLVAVALGILAVAPFMKIRGENFGMFYFVIMGSILTLPDSWGRWRFGGSLLVMLLWCNSHGSFLLGFLLMGLKLFHAMLDRLSLWDRMAMGTHTGRGVSQFENEKDASEQASRGAMDISRQRSLDVLGWLVAVLLAAVIMGFANPYGLENLVIPFRQLFETTVTAEWVDWRPLIHEETLFRRGFFKPVSVLPFLGLFCLVGLLTAISVASREGREQLRLLLFSSGSGPVRMELMMALLLVPIVFKFQRMIVFAAPAMVPVLAALIQSYIKVISSRSSLDGTLRESRWFKCALTALAALFLVATSALLHKAIVMRYLPGNPLNYESTEPPLVQHLMSHNMMRADAVEFMQRNEVSGRVFTNIYLSNYLLFCVPDIKLFFDLRAQSVYPPGVIRDYLTVSNFDGADYSEVTDLLERFQVSFVILDTSMSTNAKLANRLMETRQWGCLYNDSWLIILAGRHAGRFRTMVTSSNLEGLWFARAETRVASQAILQFFMKGAISPPLMARLVDVQRKVSDPNLYGLIVDSMNEGRQCLNETTREYLESEVGRLSATDHNVSGGAFSTLRSLARLLAILEKDDLLCHKPGPTGRYTIAKLRCLELIDRTKSRYGGF